MQKIILEEPTECGLSVSEQLQEHGVRIADCNFKDAFTTVFQMFASYAADHYEIVEQGTYSSDMDRKCGLCGNKELLTYYTVRCFSSHPLVTRHEGVFEFDFELQWPREIRLGSHCVKLIGVPKFLPNMFNSMFKGTHSFKRTPGGLIKIGTVIANYADWEYFTMIVPHSVFNRLPLNIMKEFDLEVYSVNTPIYPEECSQKGLQRSRRSYSPNAKYGLKSSMMWMLEDDEAWWKRDEPFPSLVTVIPKYKAELIYNKYRRN